jgi:hypothetical protein
MEDKKYSRRKFVHKYLYGGAFLVGGALAFGCSSMKTIAKEKPQPVPPNGDEPVKQDAPQAVQDTVKTPQKEAPKATEVSAKNPCDDMTGVSPEELEKRKKLAYVNKSPIPDSHCGNCALHIPPQEGKACGGCVLFKGPVRSEGYCAYWAPINN